VHALTHQPPPVPLALPAPHAKPDLPTLAQRAEDAHQAGERATRQGLECYRQAGAALRQAKKRIRRGNWLNWLKRNVTFSQQRASEYVRLAGGWGKIPPGGNLTLKEALAVIDGGNHSTRPSKGEGKSNRVAPGERDGLTIGLRAPTEDMKTQFDELLARSQKRHHLPDGFATILRLLQRDDGPALAEQDKEVAHD